MTYPKVWTEEAMAEAVRIICEAIADGASVRKACREDEKPDHLPRPGTFYNWTAQHAWVDEQYTRARLARAEARCDRIDDIRDKVLSGELKADAARVAIDSEKWQAGHENQKRYGTKIDLGGNVGVTMTDDQLESRIAKLIGKAGVAGALGGEAAPE